MDEEVKKIKEQKLEKLKEQRNSPIRVKQNNWNRIINNSLVIIDCWASWCSPCKALEPVIKEVAKREDVMVGKLNIDKNREVAQNLKIKSIPTLLFFKEGKLKERMVGMQSKEVIENKIEKLKA